MISVIVVTYNRACLLQKCLESIFSNNYQKEYEVIVIDDSSQDETSEIIKRYKNNFPQNLIFLSNSEVKGLAYNKNQGIAQARGNILAFTDDDCEVAHNWLSVVDTSFADSTDKCIFGIVEKNKEVKLPLYWRKSMNWAIGISGKSKYPIGSNLAVKKEVLDVHKFDVSLGPNKGRMHYGEDLELVLRFLRHGIEFKFIKEMIVYHHLAFDKFRFKRLCRRSLREGEVLFKLNRKNEFLKRVLALVIAPFKFMIYFDGNAVLRMMVSFGYMICLTKGKMKKK